ncbi:MAG: hypothetical protein HQK60_13015 [Deltaproteobacteria bacterium]|nr:hypothetical protein [Deltaproteobacteria bacterium]
MEQTASFDGFNQNFGEENQREDLKAAMTELNNFLARKPKMQMVQQEIERRLENEPNTVSRLIVIGHVIRTQMNHNLERIRINSMN